MNHSVESLASRILTCLRPVPNFPRQGIIFQDIMPLFAAPSLLRDTIDGLSDLVSDLSATHIVGIESRGFLLAAPVAFALGLPLITARKFGKLPPPTKTISYSLEYGEDRLEIPDRPLPSGSAAVIIDDVLATSGTASATSRLLTSTGLKVVGAIFLLELEALGGRGNLSYEVSQIRSLVNI